MRAGASILLALVAIFAPACWGSGRDEADARDDSSWGGGGDDCFPSSSCNPLNPPGQQGCNTSQKCTWLTVEETPEIIGKLACVPDGTVPLGGACTSGIVDGTAPSCGGAGNATGYDDCVAGLYCINNVCQDICGFDGSANAACASGYNCTRYANTFANGDDDPVAGICNPGCDPLTQTKLGSNPPEGCGADKGCYVLTSQTETIAVCAGAGMVMHNADITGQQYANSCVPGAQPRRKDMTSQTVQCGGLCRVVDVRMGTNEASEGGEVTSSTTDTDNCQATWGAAPPSDGSAGESCRYWWAREPFDMISPYSNTIGWCYKHAVFQYDTNNDMTPDAPFPRCTALTQSDTVLPVNGQPDDLYFWCRAEPPPMFAGAMRNIKMWQARVQPRVDRVADWSRVSTARTR